MNWKIIRAKVKEGTVVAGIGVVGLGVNTALESVDMQDLSDGETHDEIVAVRPAAVPSNSTSETGMDVGQSAAKAGDFWKVYHIETASRPT